VTFRTTITRGLALSTILIYEAEPYALVNSNFNAKKYSIIKVFDS
jgi:hypothetical protein